MNTDLYTPTSRSIAYETVGTVAAGQDGVLYGGYLFRFTTTGGCTVQRVAEAGAVATFTLDGAEQLRPHCNAVFFGSERAEPTDEFPLLYANVYNSYAGADDKREGTCCVYRLTRRHHDFVTRLVQVIRVGFTQTPLWRSAQGTDARPYGNFATDGDRLYAFVMRDESNTTRFFSFPMPRLSDGREVVLTEADVIDRFDTPYTRYMQGACCHGGYIYSVEGFSHSPENPPCLRVIDLQSKAQVLAVDLSTIGLSIEPEMIDVYEGHLYYGDGTKSLYRLSFTSEQGMTMKEKMHTGDLYLPTDDAIMQEQLKRLDRLYDFNHTRPTELDKRAAMLKEMLAEIGEDCYIEPPFHANHGGAHVHFGRNVYANFNLTMVDDTHIYVGDCTMFGPNVTVATAGHPIWPELRAQAYQYNFSVHIGKNCWIGAGALIMPGVTIGDNTVIGAGSVVTKDIPANVVAVGNPCRVLRPIGEHDREFYFKDRQIDWEALS